MSGPGYACDLRRAAPIARWDEALPLGNGLLGALIWGDGEPLLLSLDRADVWDLRPVPEWDSPDCNYATMRRWVREDRMDDLHRLYAQPYDRRPGPTKIPAGRIAVGSGPVAGSRLRLRDACAQVALADGRRIEAMVCATAPVGCLRLLGGGAAPPLEAVAPAYAGHPGAMRDSLAGGALSALGYGPAEARATGDVRGFLQRAWGGFAYALACAAGDGPGGWTAAWSVAAAADESDPWDAAAAAVRDALARGWPALHAAHAAWWADYWARSELRVPNGAIQRQWWLDTYKFGAAARRGAPPVTLQGVWTADEGRIPPWKGDYHHNLNTELCYWPCYAGNRLEGGLGFLDWLWETRGAAREWTRSFWRLPGLNVPMTADLLGRQMGGWEPYAFSATTAAWLAHHFYLHWRWSRDPAFLSDRAYPYMAEVCVFLEAVTEVGPDGRRFLPLSASPEIFDNRRQAWMTPTTNYDLALLRWLFGAAAEAAAALGRDDDRARWKAALRGLPDLALAPDGRLLVASDLPLPASHRHFSHLMAIHPLGLISWEGGAAQRRTMLASLDELDRLGPAGWCGYSYAWYASLAARAREGGRAERALEVFARAFCSPNSFHLNGDQTRSGFSAFTYRPFTLEGNFAAAAAAQEMLLQSHGGLVRVFPAVPGPWADVAFTTLRADGAFLVSARREGGRTVEVRVQAEAGGALEMEDPFEGEAVQARGDGAGAVSRGPGRISAQMPRGSELVWRR